MFNNLISISTFSNILSLLNAIVTVFFVYKYKQTNDVSWLKYISIIIIIYSLFDLGLDAYFQIDNDKLQFIIHHLISIFLAGWTIVNSFGLNLYPEMVYSILVTESSTIFLNSNKLIKKYFESTPNSAPTTFRSILKNVSNLNYVFFTAVFVYFRNYKIFKDGLFNLDFYSILLTPRDDIYHYLNRIIVLLVFALSFLNIYWLFIILKGVYKKLLSFFKSKSSTGNEKENK